MRKACGDGLRRHAEAKGAAASDAGTRRRPARALATALLASALSLAVPVIAAPAAQAAEAHQLTERGARLGTIETAGPVQDLRFTVALGGDAPESTHVWASLGGSALRQRTNEGYWVPWNGDPETLIDNRFEAKDGQIVFKVLDEDVSADNHGITIAIGYRAGGVLKYGLYGILPAPAEAGQ